MKMSGKESSTFIRITLILLFLRLYSLHASFDLRKSCKGNERGVRLPAVSLALPGKILYLYLRSVYMDAPKDWTP